MEFTQILQFEATNLYHIYLIHYKGKVWGCCGRSALLLHQLYPNISYRNRDVSGKGDIVPVMIIDLMTFSDLVEKLPPKEQYENRVVIEIPRDWKNEKGSGIVTGTHSDLF